MGLSMTQPVDELNTMIADTRKMIFSLQSFMSRALPTLKRTGYAADYETMTRQASEVLSRLEGALRTLKTTLSHVRADLDAAGMLSVKTNLEIDVCRSKKTSASGAYDDFLIAAKNALSQVAPSLVSNVKLGARAVADTAIDAAARITQVVEQTGVSTLNLTAVIPYIPYIAAGVGVLYLLAWLPKPRT